MTEIGAWSAAFAAGAVFGAAYLALLWAGARQIAGPRPVRAFAGLAAARAGLLAGALAGAVALGAEAGLLVSALAGFVVMRVAAIRLARSGRGAAWR
jgi:hypothetical protein